MREPERTVVPRSECDGGEERRDWKKGKSRGEKNRKAAIWDGHTRGPDLDSPEIGIWRGGGHSSPSAECHHDRGGDTKGKEKYAQQCGVSIQADVRKEGGLWEGGGKGDFQRIKKGENQHEKTKKSREKPPRRNHH